MIAARSGNRHWLVGGGIATAAHAVVLAGVLLVQPATPDNLAEQPVVLVELPPQAGPAPAAQAEQAEAQPQPEYVPPQKFMPQVEAPRVRAPLPRDIVTTPPPPPPLPVRRMVAAPLAAAPAAPPRNALATMPAGAGSGTAATPGDR